MIEGIGLVGLMAFLISSATIGVRLMLLGGRTGRAPELAIGAAFVIGGVVGYAPETVVLSTDLLPEAVEEKVLLVTQIAIRVAAACALFFTWRVFRADSAWAAVFAGSLVAGLVVSWIAFPQTRSLASDPADVLWYDAFTFFRSACIAWGSVESFIHLRKLGRRARLGLSPDPLLVNRFLLWGVGLAAMTLLMASTLLAPAFGMDPASFGWVLVESVAGLVGAATLWLTFFPTDGYRAFVEGATA